MPNSFNGFDEAFADESMFQSSPPIRPPLRRRKTVKQRFNFFIANLFIMPIICLVYATVIADGIRILMPIFRRKIYSLPVPGAGLVRNYDGFDRADLAIIVSILLFIVVTWIWTKVFTHLQHADNFGSTHQGSPIVFPVLLILASVLVIADDGIFYIGLSSQASAGWSDTPNWTVPAATLMYCCGLAIIGWWHSDYSTHNSTIV